jgi:hypothetical protein
MSDLDLLSDLQLHQIDAHRIRYGDGYNACETCGAEYPCDAARARDEIARLTEARDEAYRRGWEEAVSFSSTPDARARIEREASPEDFALTMLAGQAVHLRITRRLHRSALLDSHPSAVDKEGIE